MCRLDTTEEHTGVRLSFPRKKFDTLNDERANLWSVFSGPGLRLWSGFEFFLEKA